MNSLIPREQLAATMARLRDRGAKIVFTNGCFDLVHPGHVHALATSATLGDVLIVAINDDDSVRRLKGDDRPIYPADERAEILLAMRSVDFVTIFPEDTPLETIEQVRPDVLVKGAEYKEKDMIGAAFVRGYGGSLARVSMKKGHSTRLIVKRIVASK